MPDFCVEVRMHAKGLPGSQIDQNFSTSFLCRTTNIFFTVEFPVAVHAWHAALQKQISGATASQSTVTACSAYFLRGALALHFASILLIPEGGADIT